MGRTYIVAGSVELLPRKPPDSPVSVLYKSGLSGEYESVEIKVITHTKAVFPSAVKAMPLHLTKPSATTRKTPVSGSKRYTWLGSSGTPRNRFKNP